MSLRSTVFALLLVAIAPIAALAQDQAAVQVTRATSLLEESGGRIAEASGALPAAQSGRQVGRRGFIIGLGAGFARSPVGGPNSPSSTSVATDFKIGFAPTDQLLVYYVAGQNFRSRESAQSELELLGISAGGVTYFGRPYAPTWFVSGGAGLAGSTLLDFEDGGTSGSSTGLGLTVGGGYEFARHWVVEGSVQILDFDNTSGGIRRSNVKVFRVTVNWLFY